MVDLNSIRLCFMDFDDTICLITDRNPNPDYCRAMIEGDKSYFKGPHRAIGKGIPEFINYCKDKGIKLYGLTYSHSNIIWRAEMGWIRDTFGEDKFEDLIISSTREYKIEILKMFSEVYKLGRSQILFVDDAVDITDKAFDAGFCVASPQEIALIYG